MVPCGLVYELLDVSGTHFVVHYLEYSSVNVAFDFYRDFEKTLKGT